MVLAFLRLEHDEVLQEVQHMARLQAQQALHRDLSGRQACRLPARSTSLSFPDKGSATAPT